jgi:hypothetical protein
MVLLERSLRVALALGELLGYAARDRAAAIDSESTQSWVVARTRPSLGLHPAVT